MRLLIDYGADMTALDMTHSTPLHLASLSKNSELVQILVEKDSDIDVKNETHSTPLHRASYRRCAESVQLLIDHGADVNARDWCYKTPLHFALSSSGVSKGVSAKTCLCLQLGAHVKA